jgi:hypothetical protein
MHNATTRYIDGGFPQKAYGWLEEGAQIATIYQAICKD